MKCTDDSCDLPHCRKCHGHTLGATICEGCTIEEETAERAWDSATPEVLAIALNTAAEWHSDQAGKGLAALRLSSTRKVQSEDHRADLIRELGDDIAYCESYEDGKTEDFDPQHELGRLRCLLNIIKRAPVGKEWLTTREMFAQHERLHREGVI